MRTDPKLLGYARGLRNEMTRQERHLWYDFLRKHPQKFYKQKPIGRYIVDFYCPTARLVIELDGGQHYETRGIAKDEERSAFLRARGLSILRYSNLEIDQNFDGVCMSIDCAVTPPLSQTKAGSSPPVGGAYGEILCGGVERP